MWRKVRGFVSIVQFYLTSKVTRFTCSLHKRSFVSWFLDPSYFQSASRAWILTIVAKISLSQAVEGGFANDDSCTSSAIRIAL
jgi:hypothetical protein